MGVTIWFGSGNGVLEVMLCSHPEAAGRCSDESDQDSSISPLER
jgi:hypothetical protein